MAYGSEAPKVIRSLVAQGRRSHLTATLSFRYRALYLADLNFRLGHNPDVHNLHK